MKQMDFRQSNQSNNGRPTVVEPTPATAGPKTFKDSVVKVKLENKWMRILSGVVLIGIAVLLLGVGVALSRGGSSESSYVTDSKYQAVFLNNGQVYFGSIQNISGSYLRLTDVFYLTQAGDTASSSYTLVKLGCQQIHNPSDEMLINRSQVTFWENINNDGKVVQQIANFKKQYPKGPDCSQVSNQTQASGNSTQSSQNSAGAGTATPSTGTGTGTGTGTTTKP